MLQLNGTAQYAINSQSQGEVCSESEGSSWSRMIGRIQILVMDMDLATNHMDDYNMKQLMRVNVSVNVSVNPSAGVN